MGILTGGRHWLLRWPNAGPVKAVPPYAFTLEDPDRWITLFQRSYLGVALAGTIGTIQGTIHGRCEGVRRLSL